MHWEFYLFFENGYSSLLCLYASVTHVHNYIDQKKKIKKKMTLLSRILINDYQSHNQNQARMDSILV